MEDAMILNKSAVERGLAHGTVIKSETVNLADDKGKNMYFATENAGPRDHHTTPVSALGQRFPQNVLSQPGGIATVQKRIVQQVSLTGVHHSTGLPQERKWKEIHFESLFRLSVELQMSIVSYYCRSELLSSRESCSITASTLRFKPRTD